MIGVFAYAFAHRKTHDFLVELALAGQKSVVVIGAPFEKIESVDRNTYFPKSLNVAPPLKTSEIAKQLDFKYVEVSHKDIDELRKLSDKFGFSLGIVSGARILQKEVIELFPDGVVNFHPGRLPETSGLDALYYTIKVNVAAGVSTHFIDARVDAGQLLAFDDIVVGPSDTLEVIQEKTYQMQLVALRKFLSGWDNNCLAPVPVDRPKANKPMAPQEKREIVLNYPRWRAARVIEQAFNELMNACETGEASRASDCIKLYPELVERTSPEGWSPLIVAAYNQNLDVVKMLLAHSANPNATGLKGTTVLMYAKTKLVDDQQPDFAILDVLLEAGADPARTDCFGKSIMDYVPETSVVAKYFGAKGVM